MAEQEFRELHGDYVANQGQVINLREYLDYFEPLGSALSRLPDGTGGPFIHSFTDSGGRTIGSLGWVVSAASKRFGGWKLWGMWSSRTVPAAALPLFWPELSNPARVSAWVGRANEDADRLLNRDLWPELFDEVNTKRLHDAAFREVVKAELARAYAVPPPYRHAIEVEVTPGTLDILPWLYLLGPVDPANAQLQPSRFNGAGYQYILTDDAQRRPDVEIASDVDVMVDRAADDVVEGWHMANELRARRGRPARKPVVAPVPRRTREVKVKETTPPKKNDAMLLEWAYRLIVIALLAWIGWNVHLIRRAPTTAVAPLTTTAAPEVTTTAAPEPEVDLSQERARRVATALSAKPLPRIRVNDAALKDVNPVQLSRVAVEIFIRRNACYDRTVAVDGKFSAAEERAIRDCAIVHDERMVTSDGEPDAARAIAWLERVVGNAR
ncbi:MAG TPA: hypothetical protein VEK79_20835 [Thermoanaerobaculia bacterium]|nr:hypothetical protein [Thermoanaerobaculia bacterium]